LGFKCRRSLNVSITATGINPSGKDNIQENWNMAEKQKALKVKVKELGGDVTILQDLVYCYYAGQGYSQGAVIQMSDKKNYRCDVKDNTGAWLPIQDNAEHK
jgi:hypothetical protein